MTARQDRARTALAPLRTINLAGRPLRIYASPRPGPDYPFTSFTDLADVAGWSADVRAYSLMELRRNAPDELHELPDGTLVISELVVSGLSLSWAETGIVTARAMLQHWRAAWTEVFATLHCHLPRPEWLAIANKAALRNAPRLPRQVMH